MRSLKNYSKDDLLAALTVTDWSHVYCSDVDSALNVFNNNLLCIIDKIAPVKEVRIKNKTEPWMNNAILENIHLRDRLLYQFKKEDHLYEIYTKFCKIRNQIQRDIKKAKASYFSNKIEENKNNPKGLWKQFKSLGYSSKGKDHSQIVLNVNGEKCFDSRRVADCFNNFYTNVAGNLVKNLPPSQGFFNTDSDVFKNYYKDKGTGSMRFNILPITSEFVFKELCALNPTKSTGLDGIPARFLRDGAIALKDHLAHIINLSISSSSVPQDFKTARVKPLYKKKDRSEVGNYRPVSILSVASKILERAVYTQLESYLRENNILYSFQSGFRGSFSTDTCLTHLTDYIHNQTSCGNFTGMVLIDLQKAFDTVDHVILLNKLEKMGVSSVEWFKSYLSGRKQIVNVNQVDSTPLGINCGVPQGSILGPLLFLCYVNDMPISVDCPLILYADDSALLASGKDPKIIADKLSQELERCRQWMIDNKLSLHLGKTEVILFGTKRKLNSAANFSVICNGNTINTSSSVKYLGVTLDNTLSGDSIALNVIKKTSGRLKFLYRHSDCLNFKTRKTLCSALIMCYFDYACSSWYSAISQKFKTRFQTMQNKIVRFILGVGPRTHIGQKELDMVGMLSSRDRVVQLKLNHVFKIFHDLSPDYLKLHFTRVSSLHKYSTRGSPFNFVVPSSKGQARFTFYNTAIHHWNSLPGMIKNTNNFSLFKKLVKKHLASYDSI